MTNLVKLPYTWVSTKEPPELVPAHDAWIDPSIVYAVTAVRNGTGCRIHCRVGTYVFSYDSALEVGVVVGKLNYDPGDLPELGD